MAMPIVFTVRDISGGAKVAIGSAKGGSQMRVGKGELWWWTWMICGSHSCQVRARTRDSTMFSMYASRLLSCPMYFWYSQGIGATSYGVPRFEAYHSPIMVWPSGFRDGHRKVMTPSRMAAMRGSSLATRS